jgi:hypothetical protein
VVLVVALTLGDYLLWNWSLSANHGALALVSGLTLPPLAIATVWMLALSLVRLLARSTRHPHARVGHPPARDPGQSRGATPGAEPGEQGSAPASASSSSAAGKLAA